MLENLTPPKRMNPCRVRELMNKLDKKDQENLAAALANSDWTHKGLARELTERGLAISDTPITKHRKGLCSC